MEASDELNRALQQEVEPALHAYGLAIAGWREHVALPEWGIASIQAKLDSGARTSAIHVANLQRLPNGRVRFEVVVAMPRSKGPKHGPRIVPVETDVLRIARVRPSHGEQQERVVVATRMRLGDMEREVELSLVCRKRMRWRMLIGRTALKGHFLIDPSRTALLDRASQRKTRRP